MAGLGRNMHLPGEYKKGYCAVSGKIAISGAKYY